MGSLLCTRGRCAFVSLMSACGSPVSTQQGCKSMLPKILHTPGRVAAQNISPISALAMSVASPSAQPNEAVAFCFLVTGALKDVNAVKGRGYRAPGKSSHPGVTGAPQKRARQYQTQYQVLHCPLQISNAFHNLHIRTVVCSESFLFQRLAHRHASCCLSHR